MLKLCNEAPIDFVHLVHFKGRNERLDLHLELINMIKAGIPLIANMKLVAIVSAANKPKHLKCYYKR
jgi:hypothetical protein